jgi:hypothetical protein
VPEDAAAVTGGESVGCAATFAAADAVVVVEPLSAARAAPPDGSGDRLEHPAAIPSEAAIKKTREKPLSIRNVMPASRVRATIVTVKPSWPDHRSMAGAPAWWPGYTEAKE